jgi:hypothetical protein
MCVIEAKTDVKNKSYWEKQKMAKIVIRNKGFEGNIGSAVGYIDSVTGKVFKQNSEGGRENVGNITPDGKIYRFLWRQGRHQIGSANEEGEVHSLSDGSGIVSTHGQIESTAGGEGGSAACCSPAYRKYIAGAALLLGLLHPQYRVTRCTSCGADVRIGWDLLNARCGVCHQLFLINPS